jgi:protein-L-isoaspartate(D-aspartate) O-methyltransferase
MDALFLLTIAHQMLFFICMQRFIGFIFCVMALALMCGSALGEENKPVNDKKMDSYVEDRLAMVEHQIESRGVADSSVLEAMRKVPRHLFVPKSYVERAYDDCPLPIGNNQTISQPYIVALMTELLELKGGERVLEIGTGSGYQSAVLAEIVDSVYTIEIICELAESAAALLRRLEYDNIKVVCADGYRGLAEAAPFDAIIVTAAPDHIPEPLIDQLAVGGRMVIPVGDFYQELVVIEKTDKEITKRRSIPVRFVPMTGEAEEK